MRGPEGRDENGPAAALLLSHVSIQICSGQIYAAQRWAPRVFALALSPTSFHELAGRRQRLAAVAIRETEPEEVPSRYPPTRRKRIKTLVPLERLAQAWWVGDLGGPLWMV